ncbi:aromatic acid exporter family protein [Rossellomorea marisflavi]|nr:aromatic acid exporter family protein [Rossellomorea marisflavi]
MAFFKHFRLVGGRVAKTGIAVFLTALICELFNWPATFAVITPSSPSSRRPPIQSKRRSSDFRHQPSGHCTQSYCLLFSETAPSPTHLSRC